MVSAPKKNFPHAVDRNLIKRRMRETIRHEKEQIEQFVVRQNYRIIFAVTYTGKKIPDAAQASKSISHLFRLWIQKHETNTTDSHISVPPAD